MPSRTTTATKNAINYLENETIRGLIIIITEVGLRLDVLHNMKDSLVDGMLFLLQRRTLKSVQLEFFDMSGRAITNGFGLWKFNVGYDTYGSGFVELPVRKIVDEIRRNKRALAYAKSYSILILVEPGAELPPSWSWNENSRRYSTGGTFVASFGWDPLNASIHRE